MFIQTEATPNPEVLKFLPGRDVLPEGSRDFRTADEAAISPLAAEIFQIDGVVRVFLGSISSPSARTPRWTGRM